MTEPISYETMMIAMWGLVALLVGVMGFHGTLGGETTAVLLFICAGTETMLFRRQWRYGHGH